MTIGRSSRPGDIDVNVCKKKHMTNSRNSASAEEALKITGVKVTTPEEALEFIDDDELVEMTPSPSACANAFSIPKCARSWNPAKRTGKKYHLPRPATPGIFHKAYADSIAFN